MENTVALIIEIGLQRDAENGDVGAVVVEMTEENATKVIQEKNECSLLTDDGALLALINSYAVLIGYQCGFFVKAEYLNEDIDDGKQA